MPSYLFTLKLASWPLVETFSVLGSTGGFILCEELLFDLNSRWGFKSWSLLFGVLKSHSNGVISSLPSDDEIDGEGSSKEIDPKIC